MHNIFLNVKFLEKKIILRLENKFPQLRINATHLNS